MKTTLISSLFLLLALVTNQVTAQEITSKKKDNKYALFIDEQKVTAYQYDEILEAKAGFSAVAIDNKWGLINARGKTIFVCKFDTLTYRHGNVIVAAFNKRFGAMDTLGMELMPFDYDAIDYVGSEGKGLVKKDGKWAYRNSDGTLDRSSDKLVFKRPQKLAMFKNCPEHKNNYRKAKQCADQKLLKFLYSNVKYPTLARENGVQGMAVVSFVVTPKGKVINTKILRDPGSGCGREAKRIVEMMKKKWIPAVQDGKKVSCQYNLPIRFKLN
jgi:TonB family protein